MKLSKLALSLIAISGTGYASLSVAAGGIEVLRVIDENQTGAATSCLIMNVGAMVIVGSLQAGLSHDYAMLYTKSLLDLVSGVMMAAAMGVGVMGSAAFTLVFQGSIVLLAQVIAPFMSEALIHELSCTGSLMILAIGFNMIGLTKFKVINFIPALLVVPLAVAIVY